MTIYKDIVRIEDKDDLIHKYFPKKGIEMVIKPYQEENKIWDVMFRCSDMNPCESERLLMEDINRETERLKFIYSDSVIKNSQFREHLKDQKTFMRFRCFEDSKDLDTLDKFKSKAEIVYGDENQVSPDPSLRTINEDYIKAKKKYLSFIDSG